jgi:transposase InsO family protein
MNVHQNARLTPRSRADLVRRVLVEGQTRNAVATAFGVCIKTVSKWVRRFLAEGEAGLQDRSSRPAKLNRPTPQTLAGEVIALRRQRLTGKDIARRCSLSRATVSRILRAAGLSRIRDLDPPPPILRYERDAPGDMIHIDIKKLGRFERTGHRITGDRTRQSSSRGHRDGKAWGAGWEFVHVAIDDASRIAFSQIRPSERGACATAFLLDALRYYKALGVAVHRVMTDNGAAYKSRRFRKALRLLGIKHIHTKPYTPRTNGKAERFIQTTLREWAYAAAYDTSDQRARHLPAWLHRYNWHRPHGGIKSQTPISRLGLTGDNLLRLHT